jgi:FGGY-family pentulose kinase
MRQAVLGIDVGTGSARAAVFDLAGRRLGYGSQAIRMWRPRPDFVEQSSDDIWNAVCAAVRQARAEAGADIAIGGIGFDATCSLVVRDAKGGPVPVSPDGDPERDVIVWMDHRALDQTARINHSGSEVLRYVGGVMSPEMETPKLLWLKEMLPDSWARAALFLDLPDFLTWRATGAASRSLCSTVCKWTYLGHEGRWDEAYFRAIGLGDLADEGFRRIGTEILPIGGSVGSGLSAQAARELGLEEGTPVGVSMIDAHAGGVGVIGAELDGAGLDPGTCLRRLALIGGTSSCHMAVSPDPIFVPGVWGPYFSAMLPGLWLNEGGQSATGSLIDHVVGTHAAFASANPDARDGRTIYEALNQRLDALSASLPFPAALTADLHVDPDFLGNRSPRADPTLRGTIAGLGLSASGEDLASLYLATVQAIAYGTRNIIAAMNAAGYAIETVFACGGGTRNPVFLREHADATGCRIVLPEEPEAVLLGAAILGAVAGGHHPGLAEGMRAMSRAGRVIAPAAGAVRRFHDAKYAVFQRLREDQLAYRALMRQAGEIKKPG